MWVIWKQNKKFYGEWGELVYLSSDFLMWHWELKVSQLYDMLAYEAFMDALVEQFGKMSRCPDGLIHGIPFDCSDYTSLDSEVPVHGTLSF